MKVEVAVIGAGPAGMMAAGTAAARGKDVVLLEKKERVGRKLMITGKGRCNITSAKNVQELIDNIPVNSSFLYSAFYSFSNEQLINLLEKLGLKTKVERGDRVFPVSNKARDVVDTLRKYLFNNGADIIYNKVKNLDKVGKIFKIILENGQIIEAESVVIATGGLSYPKTGSTGDGYKFAKKLGHKVTDLYPSLVPLEVEEDWVKEAQGLALKNIAITVYNKKNNKIYEDFGEMIFTHYGLSGPVILSASSHMRNMKKEKYKICLDLKPALSYQKLDRRIQRDFNKYSRKYFANSLNDLLPNKMIAIIIKLSGIDYEKTVNQISREERRELVNLLKNIVFHIKGYRPIEEAVITSGGIAVDELDPGSMESKLVKNLFFAGEILNVDGYTGGFNLQIAFSTGYLAGINL